MVINRVFECRRPAAVVQLQIPVLDYTHGIPGVEYSSRLRSRIAIQTLDRARMR